MKQNNKREQTMALRSVATCQVRFNKLVVTVWR